MSEFGSFFGEGGGYFWQNIPTEAVVFEGWSGTPQGTFDGLRIEIGVEVSQDRGVFFKTVSDGPYMMVFRGDHRLADVPERAREKLGSVEAHLAYSPLHNGFGFELIIQSNRYSPYSFWMGTGSALLGDEVFRHRPNFPGQRIIAALNLYAAQYEPLFPAHEGGFLAFLSQETIDGYSPRELRTVRECVQDVVFEGVRRATDDYLEELSSRGPRDAFLILHPSRDRGRRVTPAARILRVLFGSIVAESLEASIASQHRTEHSPLRGMTERLRRETRDLLLQQFDFANVEAMIQGLLREGDTSPFMLMLRSYYDEMGMTLEPDQNIEVTLDPRNPLFRLLVYAKMFDGEGIEAGHRTAQICYRDFMQAFIDMHVMFTSAGEYGDRFTVELPLDSQETLTALTAWDRNQMQEIFPGGEMTAMRADTLLQAQLEAMYAHICARRREG